MPSALQLLELSAAALAAGRHLQRRPRARLELAVAVVLEAASAEASTTKKLAPDQALGRLRQVLKQCRDAGVAWPDVVATVNREDGF